MTTNRPAVWGIVNVTPDSFSDGGLHATEAAAVAHARRLLAEGQHPRAIEMAGLQAGSRVGLALGQPVGQGQQLQPQVTMITNDA